MWCPSDFCKSIKTHPLSDDGTVALQVLHILPMHCIAEQLPVVQKEPAQEESKHLAPSNTITMSFKFFRDSQLFYFCNNTNCSFRGSCSCYVTFEMLTHVSSLHKRNGNKVNTLSYSKIDVNPVPSKLQHYRSVLKFCQV